MDDLWVAPPYRSVCQALELRTIAAFSRFFALDHVGGSKAVTLQAGVLARRNGPEIPVFYKQYDYRPGEWRYAWRVSKARREFVNYTQLQRLGVPCAAAVACGETRDGLGRLRRAFILTVTIPDAIPFPEFLQKHGADRAARRELFAELARITRRAHNGGFIHSDLWVRNILVNWQDGKPRPWWIDSPRGANWRWLRRLGAVLDLASLDKGAAALCSRGERMRFLKEYVGADAGHELKKLAKRILNHRIRTNSANPQGFSGALVVSGRV